MTHRHGLFVVFAIFKARDRFLVSRSLDVPRLGVQRRVDAIEQVVVLVLGKIREAVLVVLDAAGLDQPKLAFCKPAAASLASASAVGREVRYPVPVGEESSRADNVV